MANYVCAILTNYFKVKDEVAFEEFMSRVYGEDTVNLWKETLKDGSTVYGFGCYGGISGVKNASADYDDDSDESSYDEFIAGLQRHVKDDDAVIILEAGHEKLRDIVGNATVITKDAYEHLDIATLAKKKASELLKNVSYHAKGGY